MSSSKRPPVPPAGRTDKGPGGGGPGNAGASDNPSDLAGNAADSRHRNLDKQGRQGNIAVNTRHQGHQQDR